MKVNVDAGHGANTYGKRTPPMPVDIDIDGDGKIDIKKGEQYQEHYASVGIAVFLMEELKRCGFDTMQTGFNDEKPDDDQDMALSLRQTAIAKGGCDYSISLHFNALGDGKNFNTGEGVAVYIHDKYDGQSEKLAETVLKRLAGGTTQKNRGIVKQSLAMCNCDAMKTKAALLIELAFMTNKREAVTMMANKTFWKECAQEVCKGVCEYAGVAYIEEKYIPNNAITSISPKNDIRWAQEQLNKLLPIIPGITPLKEDGIYGPGTRIAVLIYWNMLGWGKDLADDGTRIGKSTLEALSKGRRI